MVDAYMRKNIIASDGTMPSKEDQTMSKCELLNWNYENNSDNVANIYESHFHPHMECI